MTIARGRVFRFGEDVTTDDILPGKYLDRGASELGPLAMAGIDPSFAARVRPGDVIVAGANFGMGSGRESAPLALKLAGISAVIAPLRPTLLSKRDQPRAPGGSRRARCCAPRGGRGRGRSREQESDAHD